MPGARCISTQPTRHRAMRCWQLDNTNGVIADYEYGDVDLEPAIIEQAGSGVGRNPGERRELHHVQ